MSGRRVLITNYSYDPTGQGHLGLVYKTKRKAGYEKKKIKKFAWVFSIDT